MRRIFLIPLLAFLAVLSCQEANEPTGIDKVVEPNLEIFDGNAEGGSFAFYFLPPLGKGPDDPGVFDPSLSPVVEICTWTEAGCGEPLIARFTTSDGGGGHGILKVAGNHYQVNWKIEDSPVEEGSVYRIRILVDDLELG